MIGTRGYEVCGLSAVSLMGSKQKASISGPGALDRSPSPVQASERDQPGDKENNGTVSSSKHPSSPVPTRRIWLLSDTRPLPKARMNDPMLLFAVCVAVHESLDSRVTVSPGRTLYGRD